MCTGLAKLRALEVIGLEEEGLRAIRWGNAVRIFPPGTFPGLRAAHDELRGAPLSQLAGRSADAESRT